MSLVNKVDLSGHFSITTADEITKIATPILRNFDIKHFRYLKLYNDGSRILLSNHRDCTRFMYEEGHYTKMWFDGEHPENLVDGWHIWDVQRAINNNGEISPFEKEINHALGLRHGKTYVSKGVGCYNIYTFDTDNPAIYKIDNSFLKRFIFYFSDQAKKLIERGENEKLFIKPKSSLIECIPDPNAAKIEVFMKDTPIKRYYLGGQYSNVYLTEKEIQCAYWLIIGKSAEEIAIIENNSIRTVQCHLDNIRNKLNCTKQTQIVQIIVEAGFFEHR